MSAAPERAPDNTVTVRLEDLRLLINEASVHLVTEENRSHPVVSAIDRMGDQVFIAMARQGRSEPALHRITERVEGPDLHDLVRLIEYLREHVGGVNVGQSNLDYVVRVSWTPLPHPGGPNDRRPESAAEGRPHHKGAVFVGPDGTLYDANREAL